MELRFLGQTYTKSDKQVPTISTLIIAQFRGIKYIRRRPVSASRLESEIRKYRGVVYRTHLGYSQRSIIKRKCDIPAV